MSRQSNIRGPRLANTSYNDRPQSKDGEEKGMWSSMLDNVASGKRLPEKNIIVLGGSPDTQKEFIETLSSDTPRRPQDRHRRKPVVANDFALGYTYQDVLDADQEDILARLSIYLLSEPSPSFAPLLKPLFSSQSIPETLLVILLDWSEPWHWVRQLRDWIGLLRTVTSSLNAEEDTMSQVMKEWQQRKRGISTYDTGAPGTGTDSNVTLPLSQGEWDEPLGLPLCVVCHGADKIDALEVEQGWKEEEFDFVLQFLRTILMKHGASLIYTSNSTPNSLPTLIHSTLGIHSLLKKQSLKHNIIDRDKILVPPNWDSWGKIRVLREGFDVEGTSSGWSIDIRPPLPATPNNNSEQPSEEDQEQSQTLREPPGAVLPLYESTLPSPRHPLPSNPLSHNPTIEIHTTPTQDFLATQLDALTRLAAEDAKTASTPTSTTSTNTPFSFSTKPSDRNMSDHIGPVQVNMGGIQVDADDMLKKLRMARERERNEEGKEGGGSEVGRKEEEEQKAENEKLSDFFKNLIKKGAGGSPRGTPVREGKRDASGSASGRETPREKRDGS